MIESPIEDLVCSDAEKAGWLVRKVKWLGRRNAPDRLFAKDGRIVFIEFKRPGKDARSTQSKEIRLMKEAGIEVHVVDGLSKAYRILGISYDQFRR